MKKKISYSEEALKATAELLVKMHEQSEDGIFGKSASRDYERLLRRYMYQLVSEPETIYIGTCGFLIVKSEDMQYVDINFYVDPMVGKW